MSLIEAYEAEIPCADQWSAQVPATGSLCCIDAALSKAENGLREQREKWMQAREVLKPLVDELGPIAISVHLDELLNFNVAGDKAVLLKCLRAIRRRGYVADNSPPAPGDASWGSYFTSPVMSLQIWFMFSSTVCRLVQIGTKTVQEPVYQTICGDDLQTDELTPKESSEVQSLD